MNGVDITHMLFAYAVVGGNLEILRIAKREIDSREFSYSDIKTLAYREKAKYESLLLAAVFHRYEIFDWMLSENIYPYLSAYQTNSQLLNTKMTLYYKKEDSTFNKEPVDTLMPIHMLSIVCHYPQLLIILESGGDPNMAVTIDDTKSDSSLMVAIMMGGPRILEYLLQIGADPNRSFLIKENWTPLHFAAFSNSYLCVRALVEHGADLFKIAKYQQGVTILDKAYEKGEKEIIDLLLKFGAIRSRNPSPELKDYTAVELAKNPQVIDYLFNLMKDRMDAEN